MSRRPTDRPDALAMRAATVVAVALFYAVVAAVVLNSFLLKWSFREDVARYSLTAMVDGTADRPFVYRRLLPDLVHAIDRYAPPAMKAKVLAAFEFRDRATVFLLGPCRVDAPDRTRCEGGGWSDPRFRFVWLTACAVAFVCLYAALWAMRGVCVAMCPDALGSVLFPAAFLTLWPLSFVQGGYLYDFAELWLSFAILAAVLRRRWALFIVLMPLAAFNKESVLVYPLALSPLIARALPWRRSAAVIGVAGAAAVVVVAAVQHAYRFNPGSPQELHLSENAWFWRTGLPWLGVSLPASPLIPFPRPMHLLTWVAAAGLWLRYGRLAPRELRRSTALALAALVPLMLVWGHLDEIRGLSLAWPLLYACVYAGWHPEGPSATRAG